MQRDDFEQAIRWGPAYNPAWDADPAAYVAAGRVGWARSRRLGTLSLPAAGFLAYLGVQHVDPQRPGWNDLAAPEARFFVSWFDGRRCLALRTAPTMAAARALLWTAWTEHGRRHPSAAGDSGR
ncbi:MAG TPA: hypothetical protein VKY74_09490 [Chloroflexia bacterium]|nr:hypothetical protein [Chloroflexia bacterium]